jgi:hypothetical protein
MHQATSAPLSGLPAINQSQQKDVPARADAENDLIHAFEQGLDARGGGGMLFHVASRKEQHDLDTASVSPLKEIAVAGISPFRR